MKAVTIDQLHLKDHVRFAEDQKNLDPTFAIESQMIALHPEVAGTSAIYPSKFDSLFELHKRNLPWASFEMPKNFHLFGKRFFSHRLFSHFEWEGEREEGSSDQEKEQQEGLKKLMETIASLKKLQHQTPSLFERDKTTLMTLLELIDWINSLLIQINGRKLQYQKG